jgi:hypothetical protein
MRTIFKKGHKPLKGAFGKGDKMPESAKKLIRESLIGKTGNKARNWQGGISPQHKRKNAPRPMPDNCEICGKPSKNFLRDLHYDHNHKTGKFRGWLCLKCNAALGLVDERIDILEKLIVYLKTNE